MIHPDVIAHVESIDREAEMLLQKHEGIHNMHGARWGIHAHLSRFRSPRGNEETDYAMMSNLDYLIRAMRQCDATGTYPGKSSRPEMRPIRSWLDAGR